LASGSGGISVAFPTLTRTEVFTPRASVSPWLRQTCKAGTSVRCRRSMYRAKAQGGTFIMIFDAPCHVRALTRLQLRRPQTASTPPVCPFTYQPLLSLQTFRITVVRKKKRGSCFYRASTTWLKNHRSPQSSSQLAEDTGLFDPSANGCCRRPVHKPWLCTRMGIQGSV